MRLSYADSFSKLFPYYASLSSSMYSYNYLETFPVSNKLTPYYVKPKNIAIEMWL